jgi:hypothetical protein
MALIFMGMQSVQAQKYVNIDWSDNPCDECTISGGFWRIALAVYEDCDGTSDQVYLEVQYLNLSNESTQFHLTRFCDSQSQDECYFLVATLEMYCPNGLGGYTLTCSGKYPGEWDSCPYLMSEGTIYVEVEFAP